MLVGGADVRGVSRESFMQHVACVMQEPVLFARSIRENILVGAGAATRAGARECDARVEAPPRTNRTRRVPHPVLIGHAAPLTPYGKERGHL